MLNVNRDFRMHFGIHFGCQDLFQRSTWVVCMFLHFFFLARCVATPTYWIWLDWVQWAWQSAFCMAGALKGEHAQGAEYACTLHDLAAQADVERVSLVVNWLFGDSSVCVWRRWPLALPTKAIRFWSNRSSDLRHEESSKDLTQRLKHV